MPWDFSDADRKDRRLVHALADMSTPMRQAEEIIAKAIDRNFETQSDGSESWESLAESTVKDRLSKGFPGDQPILERTRDLRNSMKGSHDQESAAVGPSEDVVYARLQNDGSAEGEVPRVPARPYLSITLPDMQKVDEAVLEHLESAGE